VAALKKRRPMREGEALGHSASKVEEEWIAVKMIGKILLAKGRGMNRRGRNRFENLTWGEKNFSRDCGAARKLAVFGTK